MSGAHPPYHKRETRLYLCIYFPEWSIDVTRRKLRTLRPPSVPKAILLTSTLLQQVVVVRACALSRLSGVKPMMALQLARALIPPHELYCEPFDPVRDVEALHTLAVWCLRFSPYVGLDVELHKAKERGETFAISQLHYGIILDLTGTSRLHRDLSSLTKRIYELFKGSARTALAPTIGGSWALSRFASHPLSLAPSLPALQDAVYDIPVKALRIDDSTCTRLSDVGIYTIGQLLELPRHTLAGRFGKPLVYRLSQLLGSVEERFYVVKPEERFYRNSIFEPPLTNRHAIVRAIERLFSEVIRSLNTAGSQALLFSLILQDTGGHSTAKEFPLASATSDIRLLTTIIQPLIDSMQFCGELREIIIEAKGISRREHEQESFAHSQASTKNIDRLRSELLNTFSVRIGRDRISYAHCTHSYTPENSFTYRHALDELSGNKQGHLHQPVTAAYGLFERPPTLFLNPEPITTIAMLPDKPPSWIKWRNTSLQVISGLGPERIAPEWWRSDIQRDALSERDYFTIQDSSGRWLWIFRSRASLEWFVHGVWT